MSSQAVRRRNARVAAMQVLTSLVFDEVDLQASVERLRTRGLINDTDSKFFRTVLQGVSSYYMELDEQIKPLLNERALDELGQVERTILRIATYEILHIATPFKVVINEWVTITKDYGATGSFRFINGVLDQLAKSQTQESS